MPRAIPRLNLAPELLFVVISLVLFAITQVLLLIGLLQHNPARDAARNSAPQSRATVALRRDLLSFICNYAGLTSHRLAST